MSIDTGRGGQGGVRIYLIVSDELRRAESPQGACRWVCVTVSNWKRDVIFSSSQTKI